MTGPRTLTNHECPVLSALLRRAGIAVSLFGALSAAIAPANALDMPVSACAVTAPEDGRLRAGFDAKPARPSAEAQHSAELGANQRDAAALGELVEQPRTPDAVVKTVGNCESPVEVQAIESTSDGLTVRANGPLVARITNAAVVKEEGFAGFSTLTIDLPGAALGPNRSREEWESGLFVSMRIVRYRSSTECGLRIRLQPRFVAQWLVQPVQGGILITRALPPKRQTEEAVAGEEAVGSSGSLRVEGSYGRTEVEGSGSTSSSQVQMAFAEEIPRLGTLRGFIAQSAPRALPGLPYRGLSLSGVVIGSTVSDYAVGDLLVNLGETGIAGSVPVTGLLMRGTGASLLLPGRVGLQVFGGRAAESLLVRIPGETSVTSPLSEDRLLGAQVNWVSQSRKLAAAAGWVRSTPRGAHPRDNFIQALEANRDTRSSLRIVLEESFTSLENRRSGLAATIEPRISRDRFSLGGYARFLSKEFVPPVASSFFAGLRRSYGLFGSAALTDRLSANTSFGQSESFNFFDPEQVGTLSQFRSGSLGYRFTNAWHSSIDYSTSDVSTEPGSVLPANSSTTSVGFTTTLHSARSSTSIRASHDDTVNRINAAEGLVSRRLNVESFFFRRNANQMFARGAFADSKRRDGTTAGADYLGSIGIQHVSTNVASLRAELGYGVTPAGIAASATRRSFVSIACQSLSSRTPAGIQLTYEVLRIGQEAPRHAFFVMTTVGKILEWGHRPAPTTLFSDRAIPLQQSIRSESPYAWLRVVVFVDANRNGRMDPGERRLSNALLQIDGHSARTGDNGELERKLDAGPHRIALEPRGELLGYYLPTAAQNVVLAPFQRGEIAFPLQPGARISGRLTPQGELSKPSDLEGVRVVLSGGGIERDAVSDERGEFFFGVVPTGQYTITIDRSTMSREAVLLSPPERRVSVTADEISVVDFLLRRATARERVLQRP